MFGVVIALLIISAVATSGLSQSKFTNQMVQAYQSSTMPAFIWIAVVVFAPVFEEVTIQMPPTANGHTSFRIIQPAILIVADRQ